MKEKTIHALIAIAIILMIIILIYGICQFINSSPNILSDKSKEIIYTAYESTKYSQKVPNVNINKIQEKINNSINEFVNPYLEKETISIDYHYQANGNILSLFISVMNYEKEGPPDVEFKSYIINLKKLRVLTEEEILSMFQLDKNTLITLINDKFKEYYEDELTQEIIPQNTTYEEYLLIREITDLKNQIYYDIENSKLKVYIDYNIFSPIETDYYFTNIGYSLEVE